MQHVPGKRTRLNQQMIVERTIDLFEQQGYHNTTMDEIARACKIKKSSLYHHIASRRMLARCVVEYLMADFKHRCQQILQNEKLNPTDKMTRFAKMIQTFHAKPRGGLLLSSLTIELGHSFEEINTLFKQHVADWINAVVQLLSHRYNTTDANQRAEDSVAQIQGAYLFAQTNKAQTYVFKRAVEQLVVLIR